MDERLHNKTMFATLLLAMLSWFCTHAAESDYHLQITKDIHECLVSEGLQIRQELHKALHTHDDNFVADLDRFAEELQVVPPESRLEEQNLALADPNYVDKSIQSALQQSALTMTSQSSLSSVSYGALASPGQRYLISWGLIASIADRQRLLGQSNAYELTKLLYTPAKLLHLAETYMQKLEPILNVMLGPVISTLIYAPIRIVQGIIHHLKVLVVNGCDLVLTCTGPMHYILHQQRSFGMLPPAAHAFLADQLAFNRMSLSKIPLAEFDDCPRPVKHLSLSYWHYRYGNPQEGYNHLIEFLVDGIHFGVSMGVRYMPVAGFATRFVVSTIALTAAKAAEVSIRINLQNADPDVMSKQLLDKLGSIPTEAALTVFDHYFTKYSVRTVKSWIRKRDELDALPVGPFCLLKDRPDGYEGAVAARAPIISDGRQGRLGIPNQGKPIEKHNEHVAGFGLEPGQGDNLVQDGRVFRFQSKVDGQAGRIIQVGQIAQFGRVPSDASITTFKDGNVHRLGSSSSGQSAQQQRPKYFANSTTKAADMPSCRRIPESALKRFDRTTKSAPASSESQTPTTGSVSANAQPTSSSAQTTNNALIRASGHGSADLIPGVASSSLTATKQNHASSNNAPSTSQGGAQQRTPSTASVQTALIEMPAPTQAVITTATETVDTANIPTISPNTASDHPSTSSQTALPPRTPKSFFQRSLNAHYVRPKIPVPNQNLLPSSEQRCGNLQSRTSNLCNISSQDELKSPNLRSSPPVATVNDSNDSLRLPYRESSLIKPDVLEDDEFQMLASVSNARRNAGSSSCSTVSNTEASSHSNSSTSTETDGAQCRMQLGVSTFQDLTGQRSLSGQLYSSNAIGMEQDRALVQPSVFPPVGFDEQALEQFRNHVRGRVSRPVSRESLSGTSQSQTSLQATIDVGALESLRLRFRRRSSSSESSTVNRHSSIHGKTLDTSGYQIDHSTQARRASRPELNENSSFPDLTKAALRSLVRSRSPDIKDFLLSDSVQSRLPPPLFTYLSNYLNNAHDIKTTDGTKLRDPVDPIQEILLDLARTRSPLLTEYLQSDLIQRDLSTIHLNSVSIDFDYLARLQSRSSGSGPFEKSSSIETFPEHVKQLWRIDQRYRLDQTSTRSHQTTVCTPCTSSKSIQQQDQKCGGTLLRPSQEQKSCSPALLRQEHVQTSVLSTSIQSITAVNPASTSDSTASDIQSDLGANITTATSTQTAASTRLNDRVLTGTEEAVEEDEERCYGCDGEKDKLCRAVWTALNYDESLMAKFNLDRHSKFVKELFKQRHAFLKDVTECDVKMACELLLHRLAQINYLLVEWLIRYRPELMHKCTGKDRFGSLTCLLCMHIDTNGQCFIGPQQRFLNSINKAFHPTDAQGRPLQPPPPPPVAHLCSIAPSARADQPFILDYHELTSEERDLCGNMYEPAVLTALQLGGTTQIPGMCAEDHATITAIRFGTSAHQERYAPVPFLPLSFTTKVEHYVDGLTRTMGVSRVRSLIQCAKCHSVRVTRNSVTDFIGDPEIDADDAGVIEINCDDRTALMLSRPTVNADFRRVLATMLDALLDLEKLTGSFKLSKLTGGFGFYEIPKPITHFPHLRKEGNRDSTDPTVQRIYQERNWGNVCPGCVEAIHTVPRPFIQHDNDQMRRRTQIPRFRAFTTPRVRRPLQPDFCGCTRRRQ